MNELLLLLTVIKSCKPYMKKYITTTLNVHEFLLLNNITISIFVLFIFLYNLINKKETYENIKKLNIYQIILIIIFSLLTIGSTFIFSKLEKENIAIINTMLKLFSNIVFLIVGLLLFNQKLTKKQLLGIVFCGIGIYLTSKKN
jgi:drug/metabolite transporter (DMT)-like permease